MKFGLQKKTLMSLQTFILSAITKVFAIKRYKKKLFADANGWDSKNLHRWYYIMTYTERL
jgi:hypothetical protein